MNRITFVVLLAGLALGQAVVLAGETPAGSPKPAAAPIIITNTPLNAEGSKGKAGGPLPALSAGLPDIVRMYQAGVEEPVMLAFVQSATIAYHPSAKEIIYLRELGVSQAVLTALLKRGGDLRERAAELEREERIRSVPPAQAPFVPGQQPTGGLLPESAGYPGPYSTYVDSYPVGVGYPGYSYSYGYPYGWYRPFYRSVASCSSPAFCRTPFRTGFAPGFRIAAGVRASPWSAVGGGYAHPNVGLVRGNGGVVQHAGFGGRVGSRSVGGAHRR